MSLSFPSIWVPGSSFILASCLIGKEAISSILLDQWFANAMMLTHDYILKQVSDNIQNKGSPKSRSHFRLMVFYENPDRHRSPRLSIG